jgi:hypothetical protein
MVYCKSHTTPPPLPFFRQAAAGQDAAQGQQSRLRRKKEEEDGRCFVPCDPRGRGGYVAVGHCKICRTQDTGTVAAHTVNRG